MDISALVFAFLLSMEPMSIDRPEVFDRIKEGRSIVPDISSTTIRAKGAAPDVAASLISCYHPTARLNAYQLLGNWRPAWEYGADHALVFRLNFSGLTGSRYSMDTAIVSKPDGQVRAFVISDNAFAPYNKKCVLDTWSAPQPRP